MNIFRDVIEGVVSKVEGTLCALIVGVDGIIIDRFINPDKENAALNYEMLAAEYTSLLKKALHTAADVEVGALQEVTIFTEQLGFLIRLITDEYFLMIVLEPGGNFGRGRYELRKARVVLEKEFEL